MEVTIGRYDWQGATDVEGAQDQTVNLERVSRGTAVPQDQMYPTLKCDNIDSPTG